MATKQYRTTKQIGGLVKTPLRAVEGRLERAKPIGTPYPPKQLATDQSVIDTLVRVPIPKFIPFPAPKPIGTPYPPRKRFERPIPLPLPLQKWDKTIGPPPKPIGWSRPFPLPPLPSDVAIPPERRDEFVNLMDRVLNRPRVHGADAQKFWGQVREFGLEQHFSDLMEAQQLAYLLSSGRLIKSSESRRFMELVEKLGLELYQPSRRVRLLEPVDLPVIPRTKLTPKTRRTRGSTRKRRMNRGTATLKGYKP